MKETRTRGSVIKGKLKIHHEAEFYDSIEIMAGKEENISVDIIVRKIYNKRSEDQNAYYWGYIIKEFRRGYLELYGEPITIKGAHEFLAKEFNFKEIVNPNTGDIKRVTKSSTDLSTIEFEFYYTLCGRFITEWFGFEIHEPDSQLKVKFRK